MPDLPQSPALTETDDGSGSSHYLHVYREASGRWSGMILEAVAAIGDCENPLDVLTVARERCPNVVDLPGDAAQRPELS